MSRCVLRKALLFVFRRKRGCVGRNEAVDPRSTTSSTTCLPPNLRWWRVPEAEITTSLYLSHTSTPESVLKTRHQRPFELQKKGKGVKNGPRFFIRRTRKQIFCAADGNNLKEKMVLNAARSRKRKTKAHFPRAPKDSRTRSKIFPLASDV